MRAALALIAALLLPVAALADGAVNPPTVNQAGNGIAVSAPTGVSKISAAVTADVVSTTTYTAVVTDCGKLKKFSNAAAVAISLPQLGLNCAIDFYALGAGGITVNGSSVTINGAGSASAAQYNDVYVVSDATNYNQLLAPSAGSSPPGSPGAVVGNIASAFAAVPLVTFDTAHGYLTASASPGTDALASKYGLLINGIGNNSTNTSGCTISTCYPLVQIGSGAAGGFSTGGDLLDVNAPSGFTGVLINAHLNGSTTVLFDVTTGGIGTTTMSASSGANIANIIMSPTGGTSTHLGNGGNTNGNFQITQAAGSCATCDVIIGAKTTAGVDLQANGTTLSLKLGDGSAGGTLAVTGGLTLSGGTLLTTSAALTNGAAAAAGTLLNAPIAGNPTKWIPVNDNGTTRYIPAW